jgi:hypothetical protein
LRHNGKYNRERDFGEALIGFEKGDGEGRDLPSPAFPLPSPLSTGGRRRFGSGGEALGLFG